MPSAGGMRRATATIVAEEEALAREHFLREIMWANSHGAPVCYSR